MGDGCSTRSNSSNNTSEKPEWLQQYNLVGKIGEGTYGLVFLARTKTPPKRPIAIKKFKQSKDGDGVSPTTIREIMLLREILMRMLSIHVRINYQLAEEEEIRRLRKELVQKHNQCHTLIDHSFHVSHTTSQDGCCSSSYL